MGSSIPPVVSLLGLVPTTVSSYHFPPSGLAVNIRHSDGCPNSSDEFGLTLVERVSLLTFELVSEFELVVNSVLVASGCTDCRVLCDDTFGLFAPSPYPWFFPFFAFGRVRILRARVPFWVRFSSMVCNVLRLPPKLLRSGIIFLLLPLPPLLGRSQLYTVQRTLCPATVSLPNPQSVTFPPLRGNFTKA